MNTGGARLLIVAALCGVIGPVVLLASDLSRSLAGSTFGWTLGLWLAMMLMIPPTLGLTYYLAERGGILPIVAGCFAFFGLMAGASMQVLFRVYAVLDEKGATQAIDQLRSTFKLIATTQMIGLAWPVGLILLAVAVLVDGRLGKILPVILILAAVTFPIGRIAGIEASVIASGVLLVAAYFMIARQLLAFAREASEG